jgi:hypothetical protein
MMEWMSSKLIDVVADMVGRILAHNISRYRVFFASILAKILIQQDCQGLFLHTKRNIKKHHHLSGDDGMDEQQIDSCGG